MLLEHKKWQKFVKYAEKGLSLGSPLVIPIRPLKKNGSLICRELRQRQTRELSIFGFARDAFVLGKWLRLFS